MNRRQLAGSGELFTRSYRVFIGDFWTNLVFGLLMILPFTAMTWLLSHYASIPVSRRPSLSSVVIGFMIVGLTALTIHSIAYITLISYTHNRVTEQNVVGQNKNMLWNLGNAFDKLFSLWWIGILMSFWILGGFLFFIIPGFIVATRLSLGSYVLVVENQHGLDALVKSRSLVRGYTFATLIRWIVPYLPLIIFGLIGYFLKQILPNTNEIISEAVNVLVAPFAAIYGYFLYLELVSIPR